MWDIWVYSGICDIELIMRVRSNVFRVKTDVSPGLDFLYSPVFLSSYGGFLVLISPEKIIGHENGVISGDLGLL